MMKLIPWVLSLLFVVPLPIEIHAGDPYEALSMVRMQKKSAPTFSLPQVNGKAVRLSDYKGRAVLLGFFKTF